MTRILSDCLYHSYLKVWTALYYGLQCLWRGWSSAEGSAGWFLASLFSYIWNKSPHSSNSANKSEYQFSYLSNKIKKNHGKDLTYTRKKEKQRWAKILKSRTECFMDSFMSAKEGGPTEHVSHVFLSDAKEQANANAWVSLVHTQKWQTWGNLRGYWVSAVKSIREH